MSAADELEDLLAQMKELSEARLALLRSIDEKIALLTERLPLGEDE